MARKLMLICLAKIIKSSRFVKAVCFPVLLICVASCTSALDDVTDRVAGIVGEEGTLACVFSGDTVENCLSENSNDETVIVETEFGEGSEEEAFPTLSDVPDRPRTSSTVEDLEQLTEGLIADREDAKHTNKLLRSSYMSSGDKLSRMSDSHDSDASPKNTADETAERPSRDLTDNSLAEERRINGVESATDAVLQRQYVSETQTNAVEKGNNTVFSTRDRLYNKAEQSNAIRSVGIRKQNGVMKIAKFREIFDAAFSASGASTYKSKSNQAGSKITSRPSSVKVEKGIIKEEGNTTYQNEVESLKNRMRLAQSDEDSRAHAGLSFQVASVQFAVGSASLDSSSSAILKKVVKLYEQFGGVVRVVGHASQRTRDMDPDKHQWVNFNISMDRAENTAILLARLGIPADSIIIMARSDREQVSNEHMPSSESENRRADIYIEY